MTDFSKDAKIFKAFCDTKRLTILDYLKSGEKCACVLIEKNEHRTVSIILSHEDTLRLWYCYSTARRQMDALQS